MMWNSGLGVLPKLTLSGAVHATLNPLVSATMMALELLQWLQELSVMVISRWECTMAIGAQQTDEQNSGNKKTIIGKYVHLQYESMISTTTCMYGCIRMSSSWSVWCRKCTGRYTTSR
jgi:hypothetical protein